MDTRYVLWGALLLTMTACATAAPVGRQTAAPKIETSIRLSGNVSISGGYSVRGAFSDPPAVLIGTLPSAAPAGYTCADYAQGFRNPTQGAQTFVSPPMETSGASSVFVQVVLASGYRGPSTYKSTNTLALSGMAAVTIPPASAPQIDTFRSTFYGSVTLTVRADGSGSVLITQWGSPGSDSLISGSAQWVCT